LEIDSHDDFLASCELLVVYVAKVAKVTLKSLTAKAKLGSRLIVPAMVHNCTSSVIASAERSAITPWYRNHTGGY
jgi:hypothetical protein